MKVKRFFAADIRQAMRMVREELGPDAVIMSNRAVDGGIEILAARDFDEQSIRNKLQEQPAEKPQPAPNAKKIVLPNIDFGAAKKRLQALEKQRKQQPAAFPPKPSLQPPVQRNIEQYVGYAEKVQLGGKPATAAPDVKLPGVKKEAQQNADAAKTPVGLSDMLVEMSKELKYLRTVMESKLARSDWAYNLQATPVKADLLRRLEGMNISKRLSAMLAEPFIDHSDAEFVFVKAQEMLAKILPIAQQNILESGGIVALIGPTGVGKTTSIAKLAAQFVLKYGASKVALITTDNYRIGAHDQLNTYGCILNIPVRVASNAEELRNFIKGFADKRLILIDTAGMSQRDMKLIEQINTLQQNESCVTSYLVMSAATEYQTMLAVIKAFKVFNPQACVLTKLDEAVTLGPAISSIIEHNLALAFITDGQQVPEDLRTPHARSLIERCASELNVENDFDANIDYAPWAIQQSYA